ncbi:MAG: hypothetical protein ABIR03_12720 [Ginsengibacter sp.]
MNTDQITLPKLDDSKKISDEQINEFREKGHTITHELLSLDEVTAYHKIISAAVEKFNTENRKMEDRDTYGKAFLQIKNLWRHDGDVRKMVMSKRLAQVAADL